MNSSLERARKLQIGGTYAFFVIGSIIMIFPFVWMFLTSFKTVEESMVIPPTILPESWRLDSFTKALESLPFLALYKNTFLLIFWRVVCAVAFAASAVYLVWRHRKEHARGAGVGDSALPVSFPRGEGGYAWSAEVVKNR